MNKEVAACQCQQRKKQEVIDKLSQNKRTA
jgi:hypothetical protein